MENKKSKKQNRITNKRNYPSGEGQHLKSFLPSPEDKFLRIQVYKI